MKSIVYKRANHTSELIQILALQQKNLPISISTQEKEKEGFVTVHHDFDILKKMNDREPHIIAKHGDTVIGYALCMTKDFSDEIDVLRPMFQQIDPTIPPDINYLTMGQICIDKPFRKQGVFKGLYNKMRETLKNQYDLLITEVAADNIRSLQAHLAIGFKELVIYEAKGIRWHLIRWDWG